MTQQISHKIETYQFKRLIENGTFTHHTINILSDGGSRFEIEKK